MIFQQADVILDMCTLTGAQGIATGRTHAAHLTNCPGKKNLNLYFSEDKCVKVWFTQIRLSFMRFSDWEAKTHKAGRASGDLSFPVVYCPELHYPEFYSAVADMKVIFFCVFFCE